ncbi:hypothetical protein diail_8087 [Diaporthe ilicicola]|nr:hypothetical protein diail_8087 [Diaporthe ilicicola]
MEDAEETEARTAALVNMASQISHLVQLPRELLDNVTSSLPTQDFNALRLACKELEAKIFPYWANCFFKKKQFMIDQFSLQALVDISQHPALSKVLTNLVIGLDEMRAIDHSFLQLQAFDEFGRWRSADCAQQALLYGGGAVDLLSKALVNLPNLKTVDIRDFNSNTRYRDAAPGREVPQWRSYGSSQYQQWPRESRWLLGYHPQTNFLGTVFLVIITALGRCSKTLQNLEVILRNQTIALSDDAFAVLAIPDSGLATAVSGLTKLHLDLDERSTRRWPILQRQGAMPQLDFYDPSTMYLRRFLGFARNITWLRLNFYPYVHSNSNSSSPSKLLAWLGLKPDFNPPSDAPWGEVNPAPITLPLRRLDLGKVATTPAVLRRLLTKFADLEYISIRDFRLRTSQVTSKHDTDKDGDCLWAKLVCNLHVTNPNLKQLELLRISQEAFGREDRIVFPKEATPMEYESSVCARVIETTALERLADNTWTYTRWHRETNRYRRMDEDSSEEGFEDDEDVDDEDSVEDDDEELSEVDE